MKYIILFVVVLLTSCTDNQRVRLYGGTEEINLPPNTKLINVTWKNTHMWILTRSMRSDEQAEKFQFSEKSSFGLLEGTVIINESK